MPPNGIVEGGSRATPFATPLDRNSHDFSGKIIDFPESQFSITERNNNRKQQTKNNNNNNTERWRWKRLSTRHSVAVPAQKHYTTLQKIPVLLLLLESRGGGMRRGATRRRTTAVLRCSYGNDEPVDRPRTVTGRH